MRRPLWVKSYPQIIQIFPDQPLIEALRGSPGQAPIDEVDRRAVSLFGSQETPIRGKVVKGFFTPPNAMQHFPLPMARQSRLAPSVE